MAADDNAKELHKRETALFSKKATLDSFRQECALQFYPESADFVGEQQWGAEFAEHLFDVSAVLNCRDLGNAFSSMLRPRGQPWFRAATGDEELDKRPDVARVLDHITTTMRGVMYRPQTQFVEAGKEADRDIATFGNYVLSRDLNYDESGLLYQCFHLRDCAWARNADRIEDTMFRREKMTARQIGQKFRDAPLHTDISKAIEKEPDCEFPICQVLMPSEDYEYYYEKPKLRTDFVSVYYDSAHQMLISERPSHEFRYIVGRWQNIRGSPYAVSPAAIAALGEARGLQIMKRVILEAGEVAVDPSIKLVAGAIKGEVNLYAGGQTWVDKAYDERLGPAIETIKRDTNTGLGIDLLMLSAATLKNAWYLTKLTLPQQGAKTAFETAQLVEEFVRANVPLFEPMETNNARLLESTFVLLLRRGAFGDMRDWPRELANQEIEWRFSNPLQDNIERNKVNQATTVLGLIAGTQKIDPNAPGARRFDLDELVADAGRGSGAPATWLRDEEVVAQEIAAQQAANENAMMAGSVVAGLNAAGQAADVVNAGADAAAKLQQIMPPVDGTGAYGPI